MMMMVITWLSGPLCRNRLSAPLRYFQEVYQPGIIQFGSRQRARCQPRAAALWHRVLSWWLWVSRCARACLVLSTLSRFMHLLVDLMLKFLCGAHV
mmetsp:Transcript_159848/g.298059  ORF Transcript_159848/g.298059 Transcript_159848/m.298059 type:complete len:96 (+) Transcript_159848:3-290(+)